MDTNDAPRIFGRLSALGDPTRARLLALVERHELTVSELCRATGLPQSTASRHLGVLATDGWVAARADGNHRPYRMVEALAPEAGALWTLVRTELESDPAWQEDAERARAVIAARPDRSGAFFSASAERWDAMREALWGARADLFPLLGLVDPRWVVGDLGGGTAPLASMLAPFVARVVVVDRSREMLAAARRRLGEADNVEIRAGELESLPVGDGELDLAIVSLVLHHVARPGRALEEAARTLRPGGHLLVVDTRPHRRVEYREEMGHRWLGFEAERMTGWLEAAGLEAARVAPLPPQPEARGPLLFLASARRPAPAGTEGRPSSRDTDGEMDGGTETNP